jgi:predicted phosphodiesterase
MYKVAIFSDIHSNFEALKAIIDDINNNDFNEVICLGDVLALGPSPRECLDLIMNNNVRMLLGNHELYYVDGIDIDDEMTEEEKHHQMWVASNLNKKHKEYLKNCKLSYSININNYNIGFEHFFINEYSTDDYPFHSLRILKSKKIEEILDYDNHDILFFGHEHKPFEIGSSSKRFVDVGSSGCTKTSKTHYTILTINGSEYNIERKELIYDRSKFEDELRKQDYPQRDFLSKTFFEIE